MQVRFVALEERVRLYLQEDVEIAGRPAVAARLPLVGQAQARAIVHPGRNVDFQLPLHLPGALAPALAARVANDPPRAVAGAARAADG